MIERRASFPYLCGPKIANYWLYVMSRYMDWPTSGRERLSVAPDRHVIAASERLGLTRPGADSLAVAARAGRRFFADRGSRRSICTPRSGYGVAPASPRSAADAASFSASSR